MDTFASFFKPARWPSLYKLASLAFLVWPIVGRLLARNFFIAVQLILVAIACLKLSQQIEERRQLHKVFKRGKVAHLGEPNLLSGNIFECIVPGNNLHLIHEQHRKLGNTFGLFYGPDPWVFTTDLDLLQKVFIETGDIDVTQFRLPFTDEINNSLGQLKGDKWRQARRIIGPSFSHKQMKSDNVHDDLATCCQRVINSIEAHPDLNRVDVLYLLKKFSADAILRIAYGLEDAIDMKPDVRNPLLDAIEEGARLVAGPIAWTSLMFEPMQYLLGYLSKFSPLGQTIARVHQQLDIIMEQRRKGANSVSGNRKMIDSIMESAQHNKMDDHVIRANLFFIFIAGFETTANTLSIILWHLAREPKIQERLRAGLLAEGEQSSYLNFCIKETLRLYPAVPTAIGRVLKKDLHHGGSTFFAGTTVNASIWSLHRCEQYWGSDVHQFKPERFKDEAQLRANQFFAFGIGPRYCLGEKLAMIEMRLLISRLLLKFKIETCPDTPQELQITSPNLLHMIIAGQIPLSFVALQSLEGASTSFESPSKAK